MALNKIFASTQERHRSRELAGMTAPSTPLTTIQPGTPVKFADGGAVALTASGNGTVTETTNLPSDITSVTYKNGGVGNPSGNASFAFDGTFEFPVTGATTSTANGVEIFIVTATGVLNTAATSATHFGWTDYPVGYTKEAGRACVRIGA
ncbi:MAG: hypothetical protein WAZ75_05045 [Candidatus Absconditicoccaceae bacterium]